jgi:hypothetical protein
MGYPKHIWRFVLWPISVWMSLRDFQNHMADDYVEQTSPIMAMAVAFWVGAALLAVVWFSNGLLLDFHLLLWFLPLVYAIGFALYVNREREFDKPKT